MPLVPIVYNPNRYLLSKSLDKNFIISGKERVPIYTIIFEGTYWNTTYYEYLTPECLKT